MSVMVPTVERGFLLTDFCYGDRPAAARHQAHPPIVGADASHVLVVGADRIVGREGQPLMPVIAMPSIR
jgi:hypothetical protein